jgi:E3 ubiquitin-protein ligase RAD18
MSKHNTLFETCLYRGLKVHVYSRARDVRVILKPSNNDPNRKARLLCPREARRFLERFNVSSPSPSTSTRSSRTLLNISIMENSDLSDPSDWLKTSLPPFSALENSLRCQVCKDFFTTPMITSCSHTFCSICIRRCLSVDAKCPTCRANDQASKLRRNWALEEVVGAFKTARPVALEIATKDKTDKEDAPSRPNKRKRVERNSGGSDLTARTTRSQSKRTQTLDQQQPAAFDGPDDGSDGEYTENGDTPPERESTPNDGLVACPICQTRMKEETVFNHIGTPACATPSQRQKQTQPQPRRPATCTPTTPLPDRLAGLNYSLLNDKALRKKLTELGIPATGSKALLSRRHTEWVDLWNANVDADAPRTKRELLDELRKWDRSIGREPDQFGVANQVMKKDFDADAWKSGNKDEFSRLIEQARQGRNKQQQQPQEDSDSKDAEENKNNEPDAMIVDSKSPPPTTHPAAAETNLPLGYHDATIPQENFPDAEHPPPSGQRITPPPKLSKERSLPENFGTGTAINMFEVSSHPVADVEVVQESGAR